MDYKELFNKSVDRRYSDITGIKQENVTVTSNPIKKIKENWIIALAIVAVFIGFMLINFNLKYFLVCLALIAVFLILFIIGNKYSILCDKNNLNIKQNFQNIHIPYKSVKNVYIARTVRGVIVHSYVLVIRCEDQLSLLREFEFPLLCANIDDISKFINNFEIANVKDEDVIQRDKRRSLKRIVENIFTFFVLIVIIIWFLSINGIIKIS